MFYGSVHTSLLNCISDCMSEKNLEYSYPFMLSPESINFPYPAELTVLLKPRPISSQPRCIITFGPRCKKTCLQGFANNKGPDQPAHLRSLISAFVICLLESFISRHAMSVISIF